MQATYALQFGLQLESEDYVSMCIPLKQLPDHSCRNQAILQHVDRGGVTLRALTRRVRPLICLNLPVKPS